jgi:hypothetical protein
MTLVASAWLASTLLIPAVSLELLGPSFLRPSAWDIRSQHARRQVSLAAGKWRATSCG